ncbi:hypothetical protein J3E69DRAFT_251674 [Trichoderma sp. SZMC 28015]
MEWTLSEEDQIASERALKSLTFLNFRALPRYYCQNERGSQPYLDGQLIFTNALFTFFPPRRSAPPPFRYFCFPCQTQLLLCGERSEGGEVSQKKEPREVRELASGEPRFDNECARNCLHTWYDGYVGTIKTQMQMRSNRTIFAHLKMDRFMATLHARY